MLIRFPSLYMYRISPKIPSNMNESVSKRNRSQKTKNREKGGKKSFP